MKKLERIIGQASVKERLNDIVAAYNDATKHKREFRFPCVCFAGVTGAGKTFLAEAFADALDRPLFELSPQAGWTVAAELASFCGTVDANPGVIFVDEAHDQKTIINWVKLLTGHDNKQSHYRTGKPDICHVSDPTKHVWIFASNEELDPAIKRRCGSFHLELGPNNKGEKKKLLELYSSKPIDQEALDYLESRCKPYAGDVKNLADGLNVELCERVTIEIAKRAVSKIGLFPAGLLRPDIRILERVAKEATPLNALKWIAGDAKPKATKARIGALMSYEYVKEEKGGYKATMQGNKYLDALRKSIAAIKRPSSIIQLPAQQAA